MGTLILCNNGPCMEPALFGPVGAKYPKRCYHHREPSHIQIYHSKTCVKCEKTTPSQCKTGTKKKLFCVPCAKNEGDCETSAKLCLFKGCEKRPSFGDPVNDPVLAERCDTHKLENDISCDKRKCTDCKKRPTFGLLENGEAIHCADHKTDEEVNVIDNKCDYDNCRTIATFGIGDGKLYCKPHALLLAVDKNKIRDMRHASCQDCYDRDYYGVILGKPTHCPNHRPKGYKVVISAICNFKDCQEKPKYGEPDGKLEYCKKHSQDNHVNLVCKKCKDCELPAIYGLSTKEYCLTHKKDGMILLQKQRLYTKKCIEGCDDPAVYGKLFQAKIHCEKHCTSDEYRKNRPLCRKEKSCKEKNCNDCKGNCEKEICKEPAYWAQDIFGYPDRCDDHKESSYVDIARKKCEECKLPEILLYRDNKCDTCSIYKKERKLRETEVKNFLDKEGLKYNSYDKIIEAGCSKRRPDFVFDMGTFFIVLEVDEMQHKSYDKDCELTRLFQIYQDIGVLSIVVLRYNPDNYVTPEGTPMVKDKDRLVQLGKELRRLMKYKKVPGHVRIGYMYYDNFTGKVSYEYANYDEFIDRTVKVIPQNLSKPTSD